jgi:hypothetical protein
MQISPTISSSCDEVLEKELGSMRHRRAENRAIVSLGRSDMTWRPNISLCYHSQYVYNIIQNC